MTEENPKFYLILHNIQTKKNFGTLIRSGSAFNIHKVFLIAKNKEQTKKIIKKFHLSFGSQGTMKKISYEIFFSIPQLKQHCINNSIEICGVEIMKESKNIIDHPFNGDTAFILGNEGEGLTESLKKICDFFTYIPQFTDKTASLNVAVAGSIIFHHFATWAKYKQNEIIGEKFQSNEDKGKYQFFDCIVHDQEGKTQELQTENNQIIVQQ